jgi:O-antigen ligase
LSLGVAKPGRYLLMGLIIFFIIYLHILATKTGLLCLYACAAVYIADLVLRHGKWKAGLGWIALAIVAGFIAYQSLPTLRNRIQYVRYDFSLYSKTGVAPGYNDAARWVSIRAGAEITNAYPFTGVGFGDMRSEINAWHEKNLPASLAYERFLPANEWLVYGTGSGWPGIICFTAGLLLLLYTTTSRQIVSILLTVTAFIPMITDDTLEGQFGAVLLGFISFFGQQNPVAHHE